jgi:GNAT superfamily N-acetyltransferase
LIEGWHRTIQHLTAFPQGYTGPAWVCTGATYKSESVEQGVAEGYARNLNFDQIYGKYLKVTDNNGNPNNPGFSLVTPLNGASWNWSERPEFKELVKRKLNQPGWLGDHKYQQIIDAMSGNEFDPEKHLVKSLEEQELDEGLRSRTAAAAVVAALLGQPTGAMAQSIQGILGFIRDAGTVVQQAQNITRAGLNAEVQQEIVNYVRGVGGDAGSQNLSQLYQLQRQLQQQEPLQQDQHRREPQNESASGYIPTKRQAKDPRYSMALTVDIKPGQVGKEANKLKLRTDRQGHPQIANPNGLVEALMMELRQFQTLDEVRMAPSDLKRFAASPEAQGIRAGFEAELVFTGMGEESYDELEPDYGADERAYSVQQVLDFFQNDDSGYGITDRRAERLQDQLDEMYLEWRDEQLMQDWRRGDNEELISDALLDEQPMTERIHAALTDDMELTDDEADAVIILQARRERGEIEGSMTEPQLEQATQYSKAKSIAYDGLAKEVEQSIEKQDGIYDAALQAYSENYSGDDDSFFSDVGMRYMSDIAEQFSLEWPYMTGGGGGEGGWSEYNADRLGDSLAKALGVKVKVSGGYHRADRDDTSWIIEPDSSLDSDESDNMAAEIVSPPMPLDECLTKMEDFFAWAESEGAYANSTTGFHMGVSLPTKFHEDVDFTKLALFLGDEYVLREFGREANTYCKSAMEKIRNRLGNDRGTAVSGALDLMKNNLIELAHRSIVNNMGLGKYTSINPKGNYIEFRSAGNTNYFEDIDKLKNTLLRYARAMSIAGNPSAERNEYAKKLYKLLAPAQQDPAMALFSRFSAGELSGKELKSQWAELALTKERPNPGEDREWEAVDYYSGEVLGTVMDYSRTNATNYFRDTLGSGYKFQVREKEIEPVSARAKLAKRIKTPKEKDSESDSEQLQARIDADVANVPRRWEFYRAETGAVIDTVDDINMMQANAVRADIVRRYGHPDESVRMRSVPTEQSAERARANIDALERNSDRVDAIRAQATLGQARPAFGDVADVEPDVAQNFPAGPQQRNIGGSLAWQIYNRENGDVVRTFWNSDEAAAVRYAQDYMDDNPLPGSYSIRPQMTANESRDIRESAMMGKIESTGKIVRIIRKQHSVKFSDQKDWLLIDTDPEKGNQGAGLKWLPASTRFEWVRPYRETVDEAFDQPYPLHWASPRDDTVLAMTKLNDGSPLVIRFDSEGDHWQVVFDRNSSFEVTGEGDAQRIFATVLSAIGQFVKEHQPQSLTFSASKDVDSGSANPESRAKLYNRLVQRYASSVGYKTHSREQGDEVVYTLRPNTVTTEATYPGNIGMMEVSKFFNIATPEEKIKFKQLKDAGETSKAWRLIQQVIGVKLQGNEFAEQISKDGKDSAQAWIDKVYDQYPQWPYGQADRVMVWGDGEDEQFAAFKLKPGTGANTVAIDWIMAGPEQRQGVGSRAIKELQRLAQTDGIKLTLYPWAKGQISQASLVKLYKRHGFQPVAKGAAPMTWDPAQAVDENFADGKGPGRPGDSQRHGIPKGATMAQLEKAAKASGRKGQLARWQINMRRGKAKK